MNSATSPSAARTHASATSCMSAEAEETRYTWAAENTRDNVTKRAIAMPSVENPPSSSQKAPRPPLSLSLINPRSNPFRGRPSRRSISHPSRLHRRRRLDGNLEVLAVVDYPQKTGPHPDKRQRPCLRRNAHINRIARLPALKLHLPCATSLVNVEAILLGHRAQPPERERPAHP